MVIGHVADRISDLSNLQLTYWESIQDMLYTSVLVFYYPTSYKQIQASSYDSYDVLEFGNKNYESSVGFLVYNEFYSILLADDFRFPSMALELSIYFSLVNAITSLDGLTSSMYFLANLFTAFTPDIFTVMFYEQLQVNLICHGN